MQQTRDLEMRGLFESEEAFEEFDPKLKQAHLHKFTHVCMEQIYMHTTQSRLIPRYDYSLAARSMVLQRN
jgi:hypothetical protein